MTLPISKTIPMPEALSSVQPTTPPATAPVSYTHLTLPTTPYV